MDYDQHRIDEEFRGLAMEADARVRAIERAGPDSGLADHHDECLGRYSVYEFLRAKPYLCSRASMLQELRWFRDAEVPVPSNAIDRNRVESSRYTLVKSLIARFDRPLQPLPMPAA